MMTTTIRTLTGWVGRTLAPPSTVGLLPQARRLSTSSDLVALRERQPGVMEVKINNPSLHNAFNDVIIEQLNQVFQTELPAHPTLRAVVLTGEGSVFSAGADLNWMRRMADYSHEENVRDALALFDMFFSIRNIRVPVVGRVNGSALGGGGGLVCCCDFAYTVKAAQFGFTEVKLGLLPAVISPFVVARITPTFAARYFLTGERFDAGAAFRMGMVQEVCEDAAALDAAVDKSLAHIVQSSPQSVAASKRLLQTLSPIDPLQLRDHLANEIARLRVSPEGQHGLRSFLQKTPPDWHQFLR
jgi:methylglutaconyl-CoA hydratase